MSEAYLGRSINTLAKPIDRRGEISVSEFLLIEAPRGTILCCSIDEQSQASLTTINLMIPTRPYSARINYWGQIE